MQEEIIERINKRKAGKRNLEIPPILDLNPIFAAEFLSLADSEYFLKVLSEMYLNLGQESQVHIALEEIVLHNRINYDWFRTFTLTINRLEEGDKECYIPSESLCSFRTDKEELVFIPPLKLNLSRKVKPIDLKSKDGNVISLNRILYMREGYHVSDFRGGFPAWFALSKVTILEQYNPKTNKRVKIEFSQGEFRYYTAGASDKWARILGVPLEMDNIISALLFRN